MLSTGTIAAFYRRYFQAYVYAGEQIGRFKKSNPEHPLFVQLDLMTQSNDSELIMISSEIEKQGWATTLLFFGGVSW